MEVEEQNDQEQQEEVEEDNEVLDEDQEEDNVLIEEEEQEEQEQEEQEVSLTCQLSPQQNCKVVDVERCRQEPVCVQMVRTVRRTVCPHPQDQQESP